MLAKMHKILGSLPRSFWYAVCVYVLFNGLFLTLVLIKPGSPKQFEIMDDVGQALGWLLATILCFVEYELPWKRDANRPFKARATDWVPLFFALGIFCQFVGQIIYTYYDIRGWRDFPSLADIAYLSTFPFLLVGILLLPTRKIIRMTRARVILDGLMILTAAITFSWYFVLGPTLFQGYETLFAASVGSAYPLWDLLLIFCVLRLAIRSSDSLLWPTVQLLTAGLVLIVITDSIYDYLTLQGTYVNGLQDAGWPLGYMLIGLAALSLNLAYQRQVRDENDLEESGEQVANTITSPLKIEWYTLLPYALIPAVIALSIYVWRTGVVGPLASGVYVGGVMLIVLVVARELFVFREMLYYNKQLYLKEEELYSKNQELSKANEKLAKQAEELEAAYVQQVHLNELKDQFLLNVNHELRTPLTEIHGYLNLLTEYRGNLDEQLQSTFIDHAMHGSEELLQVVNNVLNAIRGAKSNPQYQELEVARVVNEVVAIFEPQKQSQVEMRIPESLRVRADRNFLHEILLNLLSNAFKYAPAGSPVLISANLQALEGKDGEVVVCVQDTGPGIPPGEIPLLFGKFVRLKRDLVGSIRGTGLGLYISKQLVESMEGRIWVESTGIDGEGSRFCFTLAAAPVEGTEMEQLDAMPTSIKDIDTTPIT